MVEPFRTAGPAAAEHGMGSRAGRRVSAAGFRESKESLCGFYPVLVAIITEIWTPITEIQLVSSLIIAVSKTVNIATT